MAKARSKPLQTKTSSKKSASKALNAATTSARPSGQARQPPHGLGVGRDRRDRSQARLQVHGAGAGRELSRLPRLDRELSRQQEPADADLPARGALRRHRRRLCPRRRRADGRRHPHQRRPDARLHGDLLRLGRPRADPDVRRQRPDRRPPAPSLDRLDPHHQGPRRADPQLHQVGRRAAVGPGRHRVGAARQPDRALQAVRPDLRLPRRGPAGRRAAGRRHHPRRLALRAGAAAGRRPRDRCARSSPR